MTALSPAISPTSHVLPRGESSTLSVEAGTRFMVRAGRLRVDEAPRWLADVVVPVGRTVRAGEDYVAQRSGWLTLSALDAVAYEQQRAAPKGLRPLRWPWTFRKSIATKSGTNYAHEAGATA